MEQIVLFNSVEEAKELFSKKKIINLRIYDRKVCMTWSNDEFFVFQSNCPHMDYPLVEGAVNHQSEISCPWHNYRFSLQSGAEIQNRCKSLYIYPVKIIDNSVVIEF